MALEWNFGARQPGCTGRIISEDEAGAVGDGCCCNALGNAIKLCCLLCVGCLIVVGDEVGRHLQCHAIKSVIIANANSLAGCAGVGVQHSESLLVVLAPLYNALPQSNGEAKCPQCFPGQSIVKV